MTRLELARKRAEELKGKSVKIETSNNANTSNARLELARKRANELKQAQEKKNKQAQLAKEYIEQNGTEKINSEYNNYMQSVNKTIAPKLYQTKGMQELVSKRNVITPQEVAKANVTADKIDKYGDHVFNTALKENWANSMNPLQRKVANNMELKSDNSYIKDLGKESYNVIGSVGYGIGRTISKLGMKAYLNLKDEFTNLKSDIEKEQALIKKGISIQEANKIVKEEKVKRKEENQDIVNQLDRKTIQEYGNKNFIVSASNFASDMTMAILGANGMTNAGINPIVSNALAQGAKGFAEATASTTNKKDIAVDTISNGAWGAIFNGANNLLGKTGLGKVSTNKLANFGKFFLKNAISSAVASGTTQSLDIFKSNPNYDYIDWQQVEKGIQSGKYKNIEEFLDSNDYISMVTKNRASQIIMSSIITAFINTSVEYGKNPSVQQMQRQDDAYKTLGLSRNASDEEIRSTYRKLAKLYHPDNSATGNTEMFTKINEAYHTIIDSRIMSQNIQTTQPSNASQNTNSSLMNLPQGDVSYLYQKYNIPRINTDIQLQQDTQNVANNTQNVSNDLNLVQNTSNNVSSKITTLTNKNQNLIPNNSNIQGLEDYTEQDIKDIVSDYIQDLDTGVKIKDIALNGSRARGNSKATSDLDIVVEYDGDMTEDSLFNELNKEPLIIDGIKVDINPITASKSGTLEEYMKRSKSYDEQQNLPQEYEESEIFEPKEEYKTTTLKDEIERYKDLPKEEMSFYDLQYNGYYEDTSLAIENYIKEVYDLKGKNLNVYVEDSRVSESKYIRIEDENDEVAEIRLSTHSNNETHPDYQKQVFYNKNDSIDKVERMIDEAVREVLKNTLKYDVDIMKENNYNISTGMQELYDDGRATKVGELVNEFKDKLTARQWKTYFKRIDNNGRKYNFGNNEKSVIHIGNKLVFSKYTNGKPQVYDIVKLEARLLKTYGMTAKQFADTFIRKLVKEGYNETEIREFIRNLGEEPLLERNDTSSNVIANRSERASKNDRQVDRTSQNRNKRNQFLQENGKLNSNDDVENSEQSSFSLSKDNIKLEEPTKEYNVQNRIEMPIKVLKSTNRISKPQVVGQRIWEGFEKQGYIDLNGKTVKNVQDVAELAQIFRNPKYETFRIIYTNGETIVGQEAITSYLPGSSKISVDENMSKAYYKIKDRMKRLDANGYYLVHNHPAGTAKASISDIRTTEKIEKNIKGFKGHVIVDHGTYAFISKDDFGMNWQDELKVDDKNALYKGSQFETNLLSNKIPWNEIQIKSRSDFASLMHNLKNSTDYSTLILCDAKEKINAIVDIPNGFFNMRQSHVEGYIRNLSKKYGAVDAFIGTSDENTFNKLQQFTNLRDSVLYQDNTKEFGNKKGNSVFDDKNSLAMRTAEETEEERKERVRKYIEETQKTIGTLGVKIDRKEIVDRIINDYGITQKGNSKELNRVSKEIQDLIERGALTDNKIEGYAEQLIDNLKVSVDGYYNTNKELKELIRRTKLYASDTVKNGFGQWEEFRKQNVGTLRLTNDIEALPVDTFYKELTETYGESIFPSDIANVSDQLEKISDVAKNIKKIDKTLRENIEDNFGEEARKEIVDGLTENFKTLREKAKQSNSNEEVPPDTEIKKRSWTKTVKKNDMVTTFLDVKDLEYVVKGNKGTVTRANSTLQNEGYDESLKHFESIIESGKFPTADEVALGERLIQESIRLGKFGKAVELVSDVTILGTELGQSVQAMSIIHKLSPTGQLMYLKRAVDRMNKTQKKKTVRKKKIDDIDTFTNAVSNNENLPKEVKNNSKLKEMVDKIVTGEQSKFKLQEEMQGKFNVNDIIGKIEKGEQEKIELPKEIRDNSNLMKLVTNIEEGEQTKLELKKEMKDNTELGKIVTKVVEGEQSKMDLGTTDEAIAENKKFKKEKIELTPEMELAILSAQTPEELEMAVTRVKEQLAAQMPVTLSEKLAEWRYLAMLGNPKTHIRNILGNTAMIPLYEEKRFFQKILETVFDSKLEERTTTFKKATKVVKDFANAMVTENKDTLAGNGYANIQSEIKSMRKIYKAKLLQLANEFNSNALEHEDVIFKKRVFTEILADYLTANGIETEQDIQKNSELIQKGISYAIEEAKKATFNQYNAVATAISRFENSSAFGRIAIGGLAPFKRTPLNIVKTSWQYSPLGLIETLSLQTHNLNNGTITPNDYIERVSQGLTGVSISLIGFLLASVGILTASGGGSKDDKYKEAIGTFAPYSIQIGNKYIDISWLAPATVPLIVGAEMYSTIKDGSKNPLKTIDDLIKVLEKTLNPISQMTMLSTFNDALINYGGDDDISGIASLIDTVIMSYIGQAFPTLGSQINRTIDPTIRSTSVSKNSSWNLVERMIRQNMNKIPGLSYLLEPSIDVWGNVRKRSDNAVLRGADAFINPASITEDSSTKVDKEILRLYKINGDNRIIPSTTTQKYFTANSIRYEMNAHEYTQYKINYGQTAYSNLKKMFSSVEYSKMSDAEKANAINKVYEMSKDIAKYRYMTDKYGEEGLKKLLDDNVYRKYTNAKKVANLTYEQYLTVYYAQTGIESDKDKNGNSISGSQTEKKIQAIQKALPRLTKQQATKLKKIFAGDLI